MNVCIKHIKLGKKLVDVPISPFQVKRDRTFWGIKNIFQSNRTINHEFVLTAKSVYNYKYFRKTPSRKTNTLLFFNII